MTWTLDTLRTHLLAVIDERDRLYTERAAAADKAVSAAITAADRATTKAEVAIEKRLEGVNELRGMAGDQQRYAMPRLEQEAVNNALREKLADHDKRFDQWQGQKAGAKDLWGYIVGALGVLLAVLAWFRT